MKEDGLEKWMKAIGICGKEIGSIKLWSISLKAISLLVTKALFLSALDMHDFYKVTLTKNLEALQRQSNFVLLPFKACVYYSPFH